MRPLPTLRTARLLLTLPAPEEAAAVAAYFQRNRAHLDPWEPAIPPGFHEVAAWADRLANHRVEYQLDLSGRFFLWEGERVVGAASLFQIARGALQSAQVGFSIDAAREGHGLMHEALREVLRFAFEELDLHRIGADHRPENHRSAALLERLGFRVEGYARDFLRGADGEWHDHVRTALVRPALSR
jgi:ribosomal-protein-alanine N-acetyltransferase